MSEHGELEPAIDFLRSLVRQDGTAYEKAGGLDRLGAGGAQAFVAAAFTLAVDLVFKPGQRDAVADWVRDFDSRLEGDVEDFRPAYAEALIRGALGEAHLMRGLPADESFQTQMALVGGLVRQRALTDADLERYLTAVTQRAREFAGAAPA